MARKRYTEADGYYAMAIEVDPKMQKITRIMQGFA
jgi:hypothetical protein